MKNMRFKATLAIFISLLCTVSYGQEHRYELNSHNGHLFFTADICGERTEIMVESGIPALLIGQEFYERTMLGNELVFEPSKAGIRLLNVEYQIVLKANGTVRVGSDIYSGPVFILKDFAGISIPLQYLRDESGRRTVSVDLQNRQLSVGGAVGSGAQSYKLHFDKKMGFPVVSTKLIVSSGENVAVLKGDLIVDFGNPMLVFLMSGHRSVRKSIKKGDIVLQDARDANGNIVAQGVYADEVTVCGQEFRDVSLGVTGKMPAIEQMGFLGIPFFRSAVTFDFDNGVMSVR